jgi:NADH:ubiquinone oxidoreductase subunit E
MATAVDCATRLDTADKRRDLLLQVIGEYDRDRSNLIQVLHMAQAIYGHLPDEVLAMVAQEMDLPFSEVSGVVSFYSYFTTKPRGRHSCQVCLGTACYVRGGKKVLETLRELLGIDVGETTADQHFSLEVKRCIGACGLAPAVSIDGTVHKRVSPSRLKEILGKYE